jgi:hypothetical protein
MDLEEGATTSGMIKLDSSNYSLWKPMMETSFIQELVPADCGSEVTDLCHGRRMESAEPKDSKYDSIVHQP